MILERSIYEQSSPVKQSSSKPIQNNIKSESTNSYQRRSNSMAVDPLASKMGNLINTKLYLAPQDIDFHPQFTEDDDELLLSPQYSDSENKILVPTDYR
jgi:hypothetical protein